MQAVKLRNLGRFGFFAVVASAAGMLAGCGDDANGDPVIAPGGAPGSVSTGGSSSPSTSTGGAKSGNGGSIGFGGSTSSGGSAQGGMPGKGGSSGSGVIAGSGGKASSNECPTDEPDDGDDCTLPASGELECAYDDTTCACEKSPFGMKASWDCESDDEPAGGRFGAGGRSAGGGFGQGGFGQGGFGQGGLGQGGGFGQGGTLGGGGSKSSGGTKSGAGSFGFGGNN